MDVVSNFKREFRRINRARINGTRNFILNSIIFFFDSSKNTCAPIENGPILVLRSDGKIGDSIVASGFFRELRLNSPNSKIVVLGNHQIHAIYKNLNYIDEILIHKKGILNTLKVYFILKNYHFKYILNTTDEIKPHAAFLQGQLKSAKKIILRNPRLQSSTDIVDYQSGQTHFSSLYENMLKLMFNKDSFDISYEIKLSQDVHLKIKKILNDKIPKKKNIIALNSFAGTKLRSFSYEKSLEIIQYLLQNEDNVIITLACPQDLPTLHNWKAKSQQILPQDKLDRWLILEEVRTLEESLSIINYSDLLISPDTSLIHAACAFNKKVVGVYRQRLDYKHSNVWGPRMTDKSNFRVVQAVSHDPKYWDVNLLKIEDVKDAIDDMLISYSTQQESSSFHRDVL